MKAGWERKRLGEVCALIKRGIAPKYINAEGVIVINQKCVRDHIVNLELSRRHDITQKKVPKERFVRIGDVLVNSTGHGTLGRVAQVKEHPVNPATVDTHITIVRPTSELFDLNFFGYLMIQIEDEIAKAGQGSSGQTELARSTLENNFRITYPVDLGEQKRIVALLDAAFKKIDAAKRATEAARDNARALFDARLNEIFANPGDDWDEKRLGEVCETFTDGNWVETKDQSPVGIRLIQTGNVGDGEYKDKPDKARFISEETFDRLKCTEVFSGDCLVSRLPDPVGRSCIVPESNYRMITAVDCTIIRFKRDEVIAKYFKYYSRSGDYSHAINNASTGSTRKRISRKNLGKIPFPLPSLEQQKRIVTALDELSKRKNRLDSLHIQKLDRLDSLRQALLRQAFAGELTQRVSSAEITPFPVQLPDMSTTDLHAGILAMALHAHEQKNRLNDLGHVKAEKIADLAERWAGVSLGRSPVKDAAGPNDFKHLIKVEHRANKANYFSVYRKPEGAYRFQKKGGFESHVDKTRAALGAYNEKIDRLLDVIVPMTWRQAEIFATTFAAWNNLLLRGEIANDEAIVREARENWHPKKLEIPREKFFSAIIWMRKENFVPEGKGNLVEARPRK